MKALFLLLLFCQTEEEIDIPKKINITVYVDDRNVNEKILQVSFTKKWVNRINPKIQFTTEMIEFVESLDQKTDNFKKKVDITFIDRTKEGQNFGFSINSSKKIYPLPTNYLMVETGYWLQLFEYIEDEWTWQNRHKSWEIIVNKIKSKYYAEQYTFCLQKVAENIGWYMGEGEEGIFDKDGKYITLDELGFKPTKLMDLIPIEPLKPVNPFKDYFVFHEMNDPDKKIWIIENIPLLPEIEPESHIQIEYDDN